MNGSIKLGCILSIPIKLNYTWFIVYGLVTWVLAVSYYPELYPSWTSYQTGIAAAITALLYFASVVAHELGHSMVALRYGLSIRSITLFVFGGVALLEREPDTPRRELSIAAAGPATSLAIASIFCLVYYTRINYVSAVALYLTYINLLLVVFNLLPGFPLDGGRILRSLLWWRWGNLTSATRVAATLGKAIATGFMVLGVVGFLSGSLLSLWWLLLGWFLIEGARSGVKHAIISQALGSIFVRDVMLEKVVVLPGNVTVGNAIADYFLKHTQGGFPITGEDGEVIGFVTLEDVRVVPPDQRNIVSILTIMIPTESLQTLDPDDNCFRALTMMAERKVGRLPVATGGKLVGLVTRDHLLNVLSLRDW